MIRIHKPTTIPRVLATRGVEATQKNVRAYRKHRDAYRDGTKTFDFDRTIYGDAEVKEILKKTQHGKCAYCESRIDHVTDGDVEHFRPKGGYRQLREGALKRPGYYWLAYARDNLLLACQLCNQLHKQNHFPLELHSPRARHHRHDVQRERPLFIHPALEDPEPRMGFERHVVVVKEGDRRALATRRGLGLNRPGLRRNRKDFLDVIERVALLAEGHPDTLKKTEARAFLERAVQPTAQYSAMVRDFLRSRESLPP